MRELQFALFCMHIFFIKAVYASKMVLYAQGFMLLRERFPRMFGSELDCVELAHMWRGGCVIRRYITKLCYYLISI